MLKTRVTT